MFFVLYLVPHSIGYHYTTWLCAQAKTLNSWNFEDRGNEM